MRQEIHHAVRQHPDKAWEGRFIEQICQDEAWSDYHKRMHTDCDEMHIGVMQETMEFHDHCRLCHVLHIVRKKANHQKHVWQHAAYDGKPLCLL